MACGGQAEDGGNWGLLVPKTEELESHPPSQEDAKANPSRIETTSHMDSGSFLRVPPRGHGWESWGLDTAALTCKCCPSRLDSVSIVSDSAL